MKRIVIYRQCCSLLVVLEEEGRLGCAAVLLISPIATLPAGFSETAKMLGEVVAAAHGIPVTWLQVDRRGQSLQS